MTHQQYELVIRYLEQHTAELARRGPSEELAHRLNELGTAYSERPAAGDSDRKRAVECFEKALEIFDRSRHAKWWAAVHYNMGNALSDLQADRARNQDRGIDCYRKALDVYHEDDPEYRFDWATTQYELGLAYGHRVNGSKRENLACSIEHYRSALRVFTLRETPDQYRCTQQNLQSTLADLADIP